MFSRICSIQKNKKQEATKYIYNKAVAVPENQTKEATDAEHYIFAGWTDTAANIQCDKVILGAYTPVGGTVTTPTAMQSKAKKINNNTSAKGEPWWDYSLKGVPGKTCVLRWYNGHNGELYD